jgi:hypothetical protein
MPEPTARFSRRRLLQTGLFGAAAVTAFGFILAKRETKRRDTPKGLSVLDADQFAVLAAVAARLAPKLGEGAPGADALRIAEQAEALFAHTPPDVQQGLKVALGAVENALSGALFFERMTPFTQLSGEDQDRVLNQLRASRLGFRRTVFYALANLVASLYWGDARTWARIGYGGPPDRDALREAYRENLVDLDALRAPGSEG